MKVRGHLWTLVVAALAGVRLVSQPAQPVQSSPSESLTLRLIVSSSADEAERLIERLNKGENFVAVAQAESIDPSASEGGLLGKVELSALRPELRAALRGVGPGQLTPVIQIPTGFAFLKVVEQEEVDLTNRRAADPTGLPALAAGGSVKYVLDVGGLPEAEAILRGFPKP